MCHRIKFSNPEVIVGRCDDNVNIRRSEVGVGGAAVHPGSQCVFRIEAAGSVAKAPRPPTNGWPPSEMNALPPAESKLLAPVCGAHPGLGNPGGYFKRMVHEGEKGTGCVGESRRRVANERVVRGKT